MFLGDLGILSMEPHCTLSVFFSRAYSEATATTYELEQPEVPGQYIACFQPNARFSLDINSTAPAIPEDLPFPGLEMGPVIGKGSFGYVCKGALGNVIVAVKVQRLRASAFTSLNMILASLRVWSHCKGSKMREGTSKSVYCCNCIELLW